MAALERVVREGFPEEVALSSVLKVRKKELCGL